MNPSIQRFLQAAHADPAMAAAVRQALSFDEVAEIARANGFACDAAALRQAFQARNAGAIAREMHRHGLTTELIDPPASEWKEDLWRRIEEMDLEFVHKQLTKRDGWDPRQARYVEAKYRRFVYLCVAERSFPAVPTEDVDDFWHQHILNTFQYTQQTQAVAGHFLHHAPASGEPEESAELSSAFEETMVVYERTFHEPYEETPGAALLNRYPAARPALAAAA